MVRSPQRWLLPTVAALLAWAAVPGSARAEAAAPSEATAPRWGDTDIRILPLVTLQNHGSFRLRFNLFSNLDLGLGVDPTLNPTCAPATSPSVGPQASLGNVVDTATSANMRLRYEPTLRIGEIVAVHATMDFLDNVLLGETPALDGVAAPMSVFAGSARSPSAGFSALRDSVRVKAAWAEVRLFDLVILRGGRMPYKFGLGMVRSDGSHPDADFGDYVDGAFGKIKVGITYLFAGMEFPGEGVSSDAPFGYSTRPYDMDQSDDATRWVFGVDSSPETRAERAQAQRDLEAGKPVVDWGLYNAITQQKISSERIVSATGGQADEPDPVDQPVDAYTLVPRGAFFWTPSLWTKIRWQPRAGLKVRVELEAAMTYGWVDHVQSNLDDPRSRKDFLSFGAALEAEVVSGYDTFRLLAGVASGGNTLGAWGILDRHVVSTPNQTCYSLDQSEVFRTRKIHHFQFNRDYRVDSILFREVIGAVTNAFYFKPEYDRVFFGAGDWQVGGGLGLLMAFASIPEGAPGRSRALGIEPAVDLWARWGEHLTVRADGALLVPLDGLDRASTGQEAGLAGALRIRAQIAF